MQYVVIVKTDFIEELLISGGTLISKCGEVRRAVTTTDAVMLRRRNPLTRCRSVALVNPLQALVEQLGNSD